MRFERNPGKKIENEIYALRKKEGKRLLLIYPYRGTCRESFRSTRQTE